MATDEIERPNQLCIVEPTNPRQRYSSKFQAMLAVDPSGDIRLACEMRSDRPSVEVLSDRWWCSSRSMQLTACRVSIVGSTDSRRSLHGIGLNNQRTLRMVHDVNNRHCAGAAETLGAVSQGFPAAGLSKGCMRR